MPRFVLALIALGALSSVTAETGLIENFAPAVNSGSGVLAVAFVTGLFTYRRLRKKKGA